MNEDIYSTNSISPESESEIAGDSELINNSEVDDADIVGFAYRDNYLYFTDSYKEYNRTQNTNIKLYKDERGFYGYYDVAKCIVTQWQDPDHNLTPGSYPILGDRNSRFLKFVVGRHGSKDVSNWWNSKYAFSQTYIKRFYNELNFAMTGTLLLNIEKKNNANLKGVASIDIGIAQGGWGGRNRWVLGRKEGAGNGKVFCKVPFKLETGQDKMINLEIIRGDEYNNVYEICVNAWAVTEA